MSVCCAVNDLQMTSQLSAQLLDKRRSLACRRRTCRMRTESDDNQRANDVVDGPIVRHCYLANPGHSLGNLLRFFPIHKHQNKLDACCGERLSLNSVTVQDSLDGFRANKSP